MALPSSGSLSLAQIQAEFGGANPISLSEYYAGGSYVGAGTAGINGAIPSSGAIGIHHFRGSQAARLITVHLWGAGGGRAWSAGCGCADPNCGVVTKNGSGDGGGGGYVTGQLSVRSGQVLTLHVPRGGSDGSSSTGNAYGHCTGGIGGYGCTIWYDWEGYASMRVRAAGGGGGSAGILIDSIVKAVAAGGGGGGQGHDLNHRSGGAGGGSSGVGGIGGGAGATQSAGGAGDSSWQWTFGGGVYNQAMIDNLTGNSTRGGNGTYTVFGIDANGSGGGGGGGYYGGGGGIDGGGGGGSSYIDGLTSGSTLAGSGWTPGGTAVTYYTTGIGRGSETVSGRGGNGKIVIVDGANVYTFNYVNNAAQTWTVP